MNFTEFYEAVRQIAGDKYFTVGVEASHHAGDAKPTMKWSAYMESFGCTEQHAQPEYVINELSGSGSSLANVNALDLVTELKESLEKAGAI